MNLLTLKGLPVADRVV